MRLSSMLNAASASKTRISYDTVTY